MKKFILRTVDLFAPHVLSGVIIGVVVSHWMQNPYIVGASILVGAIIAYMLARALMPRYA